MSDQHEQADLFLETTAHAVRMLGRRKAREAQAPRWARCRLLSSTYVLGEFKNTFLRDAVTLHLLLLEERDVDEAELRLLEMSYTKRILSRRIMLLTNVSRGIRYDWGLVLARLERLIECQMEARLQEGLAGELLDATGCAKAAATADKGKEEGLYALPGLKCTERDHPDCRIAAFWQEHRAELQQVQAGLTGSEYPPEDAPRLEAGSTRVLDHGESYGRTCQALADVIIAIECPDRALLQTMDGDHFTPICKLLGKSLHLLRSPERETAAE